MRGVRGGGGGGGRVGLSFLLKGFHLSLTNLIPMHTCSCLYIFFVSFHAPSLSSSDCID